MTRGIHIGYDAKRFYHNKSGLGNYSKSLVQMMSQNHPENTYTLFNPFAVESVQWPSVQTVWPRKASAVYRTFNMAKHASKLGVQIFHGLSNELPLYLNKYGIKSVVTIHDVIFKRYPDYYRQGDRWIYDLKTQYAVRNAHKIIATSHATASDLQEFYKVKPENISVVYQPVSSVFSEFSAENAKEELLTINASLVDAPYYLYVSSFTRRKNHLTLIEAFHLIRKQTQHQLVLAGLDGELLQAVKRRVNQLQLQDRIILKVAPSNEELSLLYQGADAFVYPSFFEGFGIPLAEAATMNLPMAVSQIGVFKELAGEAAIYFHPNKSAEMASTMLDILMPEVRWRQQNAREEVLQKINKNKLAEKVHHIYQSLT